MIGLLAYWRPLAGAAIIIGLVVGYSYKIMQAEQRGAERAIADVRQAAQAAGGKADAAASKAMACYAKGKAWDQGANKCVD